MRYPAVSRILVQAVKFAHVLGIAHRLERAHILAAGEHIGAFHKGIYAEGAARHELVLVQLAFGKFGGQRLDEVSPYKRFVHYFGRFPHGNLGKIDYVEMLVQKLFRLLFDKSILVKHMDGVIVLIFGINSVARKTAAQTVGAVVHGCDGSDDCAAVRKSAVAVDKAAYRTA